MPKSKPKPAWQQPIEFPEHLPISGRREEIAQAIKDHQVVIIAGETGSGKTTQIPKICLAMGYGANGLIGHTQPRRIAARTVADRIASELNTNLGHAVGYQVRFNDMSSPDTRIKLMTDGVLLAEIQRDKLLRAYEVIIIDEAHERSLNIDFLLGLLKPLCKRRPELKIIITSATIDLDKFAAHFPDNNKPAPIIEVSGRTFPVETIYQPVEQGTALPESISQTVKTIIRNEAKGEYRANGDILVFCAGERDIRDAAQAIRRAQLDVEILPLYSRLSIREQNKIFARAHKRKVVLATNVAETSITVPGIAYVVDPGLARISRYSFRSKVQRLPIEAISQASAKQRKGRCGRVANGVCIRLYSETDFESRDQYTPAEILRSNLASVILKMLKLGIDDIDDFEFIDRPDKRLLNDGFKLLSDLGAVNSKQRLTKVGHQLSELAVDPKFARILIAAHEAGCLRDALIVISALSIRDPRERPAEKQQAADQAHLWLQHDHSDFFSYLQLWQAIANFRNELSNSKFKALCLERYWSIARIFEWRELYRQLAQQCRSLDWKLEDWEKIELPIEGEKRKKTKVLQVDIRYERLHQALIAGLFSNIANKGLENDYLGTRNRALALFPNSSQSKLKPKWLLAGELLETSRLFMHNVAQIKPQWVIKAVPHLIKYTYNAPYYSARSGAVRANRKTLFYGLVLRDKEPVNYGPLNTEESRSLFIRQGLVEAMYRPANRNSVIAQNYAQIEAVEALETKTRKRNLLIDEERLYEFYNEKLPAHINNDRTLEKWLKFPTNKKLLALNQELLLNKSLDTKEIAQFPNYLEVQGKQLQLEYLFEPGNPRDGVTLILPISVLAPFPLYEGDWLVPGLLREKCIALIKTLPKSIRRNFAPAANTIDRILPKLKPRNIALHSVLAAELRRARGIKVDANQFDLNKLDPYYRLNYRVMDTDGSLVEESRELAILKENYAGLVAQSVHADHSPARAKHERKNLHEWDFGELKRSIEFVHQGMTVVAYPSLNLLEDGSISLQLCESQALARYQTALALPALALKALNTSGHSKTVTYLRKELFKKKQATPTNLSSLAQQLQKSQSSDKSAWIEPVLVAALGGVCFGQNINKIRTAEAFDSALSKGVKEWVKAAMELEKALDQALTLRDELLSELLQLNANSLSEDLALEDIKSQLYRMFEPEFLSYTPLAELKQYPRYLRAAQSRLERLQGSEATRKQAQHLLATQNEFDSYITRGDRPLAYQYVNNPALKEFAKLVQEWRVSIFAQHLRTQVPVSEKRISKAWKEIIEPI